MFFLIKSQTDSGIGNIKAACILRVIIRQKAITAMTLDFWSLPM